MVLICVLGVDHLRKVLHDWYIVVDSGSMLLGHTLGYPNYVAVFLLFELQKRVEYAKAKLSHKCIQIHFDFLLKKAVLNSFVARVVANIFKQWPVFLLKINEC